MSGVVALQTDTWSGPFDADLRGQAVAELEAGRVLFLPELKFALSPEELDWVRQAKEAPAGEGAKSASFDPATGKCKPGPLSEVLAERLGETMVRFSRLATELIEGLFPEYAPGLEPARTSFRPVEVEGRSQSWRHDDRRLHVDAFPTRPMAGRRILRVFSNVDPSGQPRSWRLGEPFEAHARRFQSRLPRPSRTRAFMLSRLGLTHGRQTSYDQLMLGLHDAAKRDQEYQSSADAQFQDFPAGTSWIVYTDQTPHAALAGSCAFEQTFHVRPEVMVDPGKAPLAILERLMGRSLV